MVEEPPSERQASPPPHDTQDENQKIEPVPTPSEHTAPAQSAEAPPTDAESMDEDEITPILQVEGPTQVPEVDRPAQPLRPSSPVLPRRELSPRAPVSPIEKNRRYLNARSSPRLAQKATAQVETQVPGSSAAGSSGQTSSGQAGRPPLAPKSNSPVPMSSFSASVPLPPEQMVTPPTNSSAFARGSGSNSQGARSPLAMVHRQALLRRGVDACALDEASLEDLRLLMSHHPSDSSEGN